MSRATVRFLRGDWLSHSAVSLAAAGLSLSVCGLTQGSNWVAMAGAVVTAGCAGWALWRIRLISRMLAAGPRLSGRVVRRRDSGHALVTYALGNQVYESTIAVQGGPAHFDPRRGDDVAIIIDPHKPTRAFFLETLSR